MQVNDERQSATLLLRKFFPSVASSFLELEIYNSQEITLPARLVLKKVSFLEFPLYLTSIITRQSQIKMKK